MKVAFWVSVYVAVAMALLAVALTPAQGRNDPERRRVLSAELGLISVLTSEALKGRSPDALADSLAGYRPGCSIHVADADGVRLIVGEDRELPRPIPSGRELIVQSPRGGHLIWRSSENADGSTVVASARVPRAARGPGRAVGLAGLVVLGAAGCIHTALSRRGKPARSELKPECRPETPVRGLVPRPRSRRAMGLATGTAAGLGELARSELLRQLVRRVRRCA